MHYVVSLAGSELKGCVSVISYHTKVSNKHSFGKQHVCAMGNQAPCAMERSAADKHQHRAAVMQGGKPTRLCETHSKAKPTPPPSQRKNHAGHALPKSQCHHPILLLIQGRSTPNISDTILKERTPLRWYQGYLVRQRQRIISEQTQQPLPPPALQGDERK